MTTPDLFNQPPLPDDRKSSQPIHPNRQGPRILQSPKEPITLRSYQTDCVEDALDTLDYKGAKEIAKVITAPTGSGKSLIIAHTAVQSGKPTIVFQPSYELLMQNVQKAQEAGAKVSIYSASASSRQIGHLTYATLPSVKDIGSRFRGYNLLIDEAHLYPPKEDSMIRKFLTDSGIKTIVGFTATPFRLKTYALRYSQLGLLHRQQPSLFKLMGHVVQVAEMVGGGWWSPLQYIQHETSDIGLVMDSSGSDYTDTSLQYNSQATNMVPRMAELAMQRVREGRKSIVCYLSSIADAERLKTILGPANCVCVHGKLKDTDRKFAIDRFKSGRVPIAVNVNVLATGFDFAEIDCLIIGRPTQSLALYYQIVGRGVRLTKTGQKLDCIVDDMAGLVKKFGMVEDLSLEQLDGAWWLFGTGGKLLTGVPMDGSIHITRKSIKDYKRAQKEFVRRAQEKRAFDSRVKQDRRHMAFTGNSHGKPYYGKPYQSNF